MVKKNKQEKVLVALSGGVDSAVAAALLVKAGHQVTAAFMINYDEAPSAGSEHCWVPDYRDAVRVAAALSIPIIRLDFTKEYRAQVLEHTFAEYRAGRTPNPDVLCNKFIKFGSWLERIKKLGFTKFATGHYAQIRAATADGKTNCRLLQAKDANKDQTYFLCQLNQEQLQHTIFPVGKHTKPRVRALAKKFNLPVAAKEESMGICFIGEVSMTEFLGKHIQKSPGPIVRTDGTVVGEHIGLPFYTIGQRHLGAKLTKESRPLYVVDKRAPGNELVIGFDDDALLYKKNIAVSGVSWVSGQPPKFPLHCTVRLRHRQPLQRCSVTERGRQLNISCAKPQRAVTPGQFAVLYKDKVCLGGGVIN